MHKLHMQGRNFSANLKSMVEQRKFFTDFQTPIATIMMAIISNRHPSSFISSGRGKRSSTKDEKKVFLCVFNKNVKVKKKEEEKK